MTSIERFPEVVMSDVVFRSSCEKCDRERRHVKAPGDHGNASMYVSCLLCIYVKKSRSN